MKQGRAPRNRAGSYNTKCCWKAFSPRPQRRFTRTSASIFARLKPTSRATREVCWQGWWFRLDGRGAVARRCGIARGPRVAAEAAAPEKVLIAGVGRESVKATLELADAAAALRYDAVLVRPPSYYAGQMSSALCSIISAASPTVRRYPWCFTTFPSACRMRFPWNWWANWPGIQTLLASRIRPGRSRGSGTGWRFAKCAAADRAGDAGI